MQIKQQLEVFFRVIEVQYFGLLVLAFLSFIRFWCFLPKNEGFEEGMILLLLTGSCIWSFTFSNMQFSRFVKHYCNYMDNKADYNMIQKDSATYPMQIFIFSGVWLAGFKSLAQQVD